MQRGIAKLLLNHLDAWSVTLIITVLALLTHRIATPRALFLLFLLPCLYWLGFALNDYFDAPFDATTAAKAQGNFFVQRPRLSPTRWLGVVLAAMLLLVVMGLIYGTVGTAVTLLGLLVMWVYSAPPLRLKSRPGLDLLTHAVFVEAFPYLVCLLLLPLRWTPLDTAVLSLLFLSSLTAQLEQQVRDYDVDRRHERTFATWFGRRRTHRLQQLVTGLLVATAVFHLVCGAIPLYLLPYGLIGLPALLHRLLRSADTPPLRPLAYLLPLSGLGYTAVLGLYFFFR